MKNTILDILNKKDLMGFIKDENINNNYESEAEMINDFLINNYKPTIFQIADMVQLAFIYEMNKVIDYCECESIAIEIEQKMEVE